MNKNSDRIHIPQTSESLPLRVYSSVWQIPHRELLDRTLISTPEYILTCMKDPNTNFMRLRRGDLNLFDLELLAGSPTDCGFASYSFTNSWRHDNLLVVRAVDRKIQFLADRLHTGIAKCPWCGNWKIIKGFYTNYSCNTLKKEI